MEYLITFTTILLTFLTTPTTNAKHPQCSSSKPDGSNDVSVFHVYAECSPFSHSRLSSEPWPNMVLNMASKDSKRVEFLDSLVAKKKPTKAPIGSGQNILNIGSYLVRAQIGSPAQLMFMAVDTSYDASWVPCSGCLGCTSTVSFSTNSSSTFGPLDCSSAQCTLARGLQCTDTEPDASCKFSQSYGDSSLSATLSRDSFTLGNDVIPEYTFGCLTSISGKSIPPQGLLGLGRGPLSLIAQTNSLYEGIFSYCLPSFKSYYFSGSLKLGPLGQPTKIKTTPLLQNLHRPSLYYVNLTAVSVGRVLVPIEAQYLSFDPQAGSGTIIDSGTVTTRFVRPAYEAIRDEFRAQVKGPFSQIGTFDTCFPVTHEQVSPIVTLHFTELDLKLPMENTLIHSSAGTSACLSMASNMNSELNIIGSLQQQNLRIMFDTVNSRLGIAHEVCN